MPITQEVRDLIQRLNTRTNEMSVDVTAVQTRIDALIARIGTGASPEEIQTIKTELEAVSASLDPIALNLDAMGAVVDNPIPPPVEPPVDPNAPQSFRARR